MQRWLAIGTSVLMFTLTHSTPYAQEPQHSPDVPAGPRDTLRYKNTANVFFERNLNTFNWIGRVNLDTSLGGTRINLDDQYSSNIILLEGTPASSQRKLQSSQHNSLLQLSRPVLPELKTLFRWASLTYADEKAVGLSNASNYSLLGGFEYDPFPFLALSPLAGYRWENQRGMNDRGLSYTLDARLLDVITEDYLFAGAAQFHQDRLDPRLLERHFARMGVQKTFAAQTRDSLVFAASRNRQEFYTLPGNNIESRIDNVFSFSNLLDYELDHNLVASGFVSVINRSLDRDLRSRGVVADSTPQFNTSINEFRLESYLQAVYGSHDGRSLVSTRLSYSERDESHQAKPIPGASPGVEILFGTRNKQEQTKDNLTRRTSLAGTASFPLSFSDRVSVSGAASILRYDTPSELNLEDRDEVLVAMTLATSHHISQYLDLTFSLEGILSHVVYLLKERSANNNYNRILRFSPRAVYRPFQALSTVNTFEVLANYTVYDYEQQVALVRSFSYRQFAWMDSTSWEVTPRFGLDFFGYLKLYERGQLSWTDFKERTENSFVDRTYAVQARFTPFPRLLAAVGLRYFSQSRYVYGQEGKRLDLFVRSVGPTCMIVWEINRYGRLGLKGWYEQRQQTGGMTRPIPNMTMDVALNF